MLTTIFKRKTKSEPGLQFGTTIIGKAPCQGDFIRSGMTHGNAVQVDHWLEQGFAQLIKESQGTYQGQHQTIHYCMRFMAQPSLARGALFASHDKSGRAYPLSITQWMTMPDILSAFPPFLPAYAQPMWGSLTQGAILPWQQEHEMMDWSSRSKKSAYQYKSDTECLKAMHQIIDIPSQQWASRWPDAPKIIAEGIDSLIHYDMMDQGLVVPIPYTGEDALPYVVFWLQLCEHFLPMRWQQVFWYQNGDSAELLIQYQSKNAQALGYLLSPYVLLTDTYRRLTGSKRIGLLPQVESWLSQPQLTLSHLMHNIMHLSLR